MDASKALWGALIVVSMSLAGCAGGDEALGIKVTAAGDPVTEATVFEATGSADRFLWDFSDGTGFQEGRKVEHVFGFTDGEVTVRLTAETGDASETTSTKVDLGGSRNVSPSPAMAGTSNWVTPGTTVTISGAGSTDDNGDPILFRWTCQALGEALPAHGDDHGAGGLPFGIQVLGTVDANLTGEATTIDGDLCDGLNARSGLSRDGTIQGSFTTVGVYNIDVEIRDPKSPSQVGRFQVFVTPDIPPATETLSLSGSLTVGSGGQIQNAMDEIDNPAGIVWDEETHTFRLPLPVLDANVAFATSGTPGSAVTWELLAGGTTLTPASSDASKAYGFHELVNGVNYEVVFQLDPGMEVSYTWDLAVTYDLQPTILWEAPLPT